MAQVHSEKKYKRGCSKLLAEEYDHKGWFSEFHMSNPFGLQNQIPHENLHYCLTNPSDGKWRKTGTCVMYLKSFVFRAGRKVPHCQKWDCQKPWNHKRQEGWHKHPRAELGRTAFGSPNSVYLSNPKNGHQTNRRVQWHHLAHLAVSCGVVWSRQDSAAKDIKTVVKPKFCISSLLTESAGVMKSKLFPQCKQRIHPVLNIYYYSLTGWYWTPGIHNPTRKVAALVNQFNKQSSKCVCSRYDDCEKCLVTVGKSTCTHQVVRIAPCFLCPWLQMDDWRVLPWKSQATIVMMCLLFNHACPRVLPKLPTKNW